MFQSKQGEPVIEAQRAKARGTRSDDELEAHLQATSPAPRITPGDVEATIASEFYFTAGEGVLGASELGTRPAGLARSLNQLTFCVLVLRNGYTVVGKSACASPENFDAQVGREYARKDAVRDIYPLLGYELRTKLSQPTKE